MILVRLLSRISARQLRQRPARVALVVGGIAVGVALIVAIRVINGSILENVRETIRLMAGPADLEVVLGLGEVGFKEAVVADVRAVDGVAAAIPIVRGTVSLAESPEETLQLFGLDLTAEADLANYTLSLSTERRRALQLVGDPLAMLMTERLAHELGVTLGERVAIASPTGVKTLVVRGLLAEDGVARAFSGRIVVMDLPAAQMLLGRESLVDQVDVVLKAGVDVALVEQRLRNALPQVFSVRRPEQRGEQYERVFRSFQAMLDGLSMLCLIAGIFIIYNTTSTAATERGTELARLQVIGAESHRLFAVLLAEAAILGAAGTAAGVAIGFGLAHLLAPLVRDSMGIIFQLRMPIDRLSPGVTQLLFVAGLGTGACIFASAFAARRITRMDPLAAVRVTPPPPAWPFNPKRWLWIWTALLALSGLALAMQGHTRSVVWGNFGATLWNASIIVVAVPLVRAVGQAVVRVLPARFAAEGRVAADSMTRFPVRTGITTAAIALVLTVAVFIASLALSFRRSMNDYLGRFLAADLTVSAVSTEGGWLETPMSARMAELIAAIPGVRSVDALRVVAGQEFRGMRITVGGLSDGFFDPTRYPEGWFREGSAEAANPLVREGKAVTISTGLADRTGLGVGDTITLNTPTGPLTRPIVGVVPDYTSDRGTVIMSRRLLERAWGIRDIHRVLVHVAPSVPIEAVRSAIVKELGREYRLKVLSLREVFAYHDEKIAQAFAFTRAIQLLVVIITVAGIFDLLLSTIAERRSELNLWRLMGAENSMIRRSIIIESGTIGLLGSVLGIGVGLITAWIWIRLNFRYLLGYYLEQHFAIGNALVSIALVLTMTMLAGYLAARRALRGSVLDGLRND